jgi:hypothetical protein
MEEKMAFWVVVAVGAICVFAAIAFIYKGIGGSSGGTTFKAFGIEFSAQQAGQGGLLLVVGAALLMIAVHLTPPTAPPSEAPASLTSPQPPVTSSQPPATSPQPPVNRILAINYRRDGTDNYGEFRRKGQFWEESYKDINEKGPHEPRKWSESSIAPGEILLADGPATIKIDLAAKAIYYSDHSGGGFSHLDTITSVVPPDGAP